MKNHARCPRSHVETCPFVQFQRTMKHPCNLRIFDKSYYKNYNAAMKMQSVHRRGTARVLAYCALSIFFTSCATTKMRDMRYPVYVTNTNIVDLLAPEYIDGAVDSLYLLSGTAGGTSFFVQAFMQADKSGMFITLFNDFGVDMGTLTYTRESLSLDSSVFPKYVKPQYIAIDMQFAFYAPDAIAAALQSAALDFVVEKADSREVRKIMKGKKCIEEVIKTRDTIQIVNYLRRYEYNLSEVHD